MIILLAHSTSDCLQDILRSYFGENFLCDAELVVIFNGKHRSSFKDTHEQFRILWTWVSVNDWFLFCFCFSVLCRIKCSWYLVFGKTQGWRNASLYRTKSC